MRICDVGYMHSGVGGNAVRLCKTRYSRMTFANALRSFKICQPSVSKRPDDTVSSLFKLGGVVTHYKAGCFFVDSLAYVCT